MLNKSMQQSILSQLKRGNPFTTESEGKRSLMKEIAPHFKVNETQKNLLEELDT